MKHFLGKLLSLALCAALLLSLCPSGLAESAEKGELWLTDEKITLVYDDQVLLTAGHTDDLSVAGRPADRWGWLADRGFSILQTDWPMALSQYFKERNAGREAERG